jgi:glycosyltransferase involved in cell wall biosynthesis
MHNITLSKSKSLINSATDYLKESNGCDLAISIFLDYNSSIPAKLKQSGAKRIMVIDQMSRPEVTRSFPYRIKYLLKGIINFVHIDKIIAVSQFVKSSISRELGFWWKPKVVVVYNSIDVNLFKPASEKVERIPYSIFCIAHLIKEKGIHDLIIAISKLSEEYKNKVSLTIAGDGMYKQKLIELSSHYGLAEKVHFVGNINNQDEQMRRHEICVVPSLWKEAFGYTNVESMASGCILLASEIGGIPEIINNRSNGFLFTAGDSIHLSKKLMEIFNLTDAQKRDIILESIKTVESRFNLNINVSEYVQLIEKLT